MCDCASMLIGLCDRALIAVMTYAFGRSIAETELI
jgi:hypothetical protein